MVARLLAVGFAELGRILGGAPAVADDPAEVGVERDVETHGARYQAKPNRYGSPPQIIDGTERAAREVDDPAGPCLGAVIVDAANYYVAVIQVGDFQKRSTRKRARRTC